MPTERRFAFTSKKSELAQECDSTEHAIAPQRRSTESSTTTTAMQQISRQEESTQTHNNMSRFFVVRLIAYICRISARDSARGRRDPRGRRRPRVACREYAPVTVVGHRSYARTHRQRAIAVGKVSWFRDVTPSSGCPDDCHPACDRHSVRRLGEQAGTADSTPSANLVGRSQSIASSPGSFPDKSWI
jgi:hypothetical protein